MKQQIRKKVDEMEEWVPGEENVCSKMVHKMLIAN